MVQLFLCFCGKLELMASKNSGGHKRPKRAAPSKKKARKASGVPTFKQPMSPDEGRAALDTQIDLANQIIAENPKNPFEFAAMQDRLNRWDGATRDALYAIADDDSLLSVYKNDEGPPTGMLGRELVLEEEAENIRRHLHDRVAMLETFKRDLH